MSPSQKKAKDPLQATFDLNTRMISAPDKLCIQATMLVMTVIHKILRRVYKALERLQKYPDVTCESQLRVTESQLTAVVEYCLEASMRANSEDICYKSQDDYEWTKLKDHYSVYVCLIPS